MAISDPFAKVTPAWIETHDLDNGADTIAIMSGVRIRRNIDGFAFPGRCEKSELYDLAALALGVIGHSDRWESFDFRMMDSLDGLSRNILLESRMITPVLAQGGPGRFLMHDADGEIACMINEEDHLSVSMTRPGVDLSYALDRAESLVESLDIKFMKDSVLGYLTANPSYVGTGVRSFVLLHLPALDALDEMPKICDSLARDWKRLSFYRLLSDKNNDCGSFFLISNRVTLAVTPEEITEEVADAAQSLASKELSARHKIRASRDVEIDDRLWRAWGILRHARKLSFNEAINMFSLVKLGSDMGILPHIYNREWKKMILGAQKHHLALASQGIIREQSEETRVRAARFRQFMEKKSSAASFESGLG